MKIGIMQPYFLPYIGYFTLIKYTDKFILFDTVQFIKHGWIERNRILKQQNSKITINNWQYISVPLVKHHQETKIKDIKLNNTIDWREKIFSQLKHYKKIAPYYNETIKTLRIALDIQTNSITKLNEHILKIICNYLDIKFNVDIFSEMNLKIDKVNAPDEWALNICKSLKNVDEYWNPEGGLKFFDRNKYIKENISLKFLKMNITPYSQRNVNNFESSLSIIDVMMFNSPIQINKMLDNYELL